MGAANDNGRPGFHSTDPTEIVVTAQKSMQRELNEALKTLGDKILGPTFTDNLGTVMSKVLRGAAYGQAASGILSSLGVKQSSTGGMLGGAFGNAAFGPVGGIVGGILGGTIGGLFKKAARGYSVITSAEDGGYSVSGNKSGVRSNLTGAATSVQSGLQQVAERLNAELGDFRVSIGEYKGWYRVSASGSSNVGDKKYPKWAGSDLIYDGQDQAEATRVAILNAIQDGAVKGLRAGAQRLLQAGKDIDSAVQKALDFESVFTRLKEYRDPVGAALDTLDREFTRLKKIFDEASASAAEYAELEELYGKERAKVVREAAERITSGMKSLWDELMFGDNGRSLRHRLSAAQDAYDPLRARVESGDRSAYDAYSEAAQTLLDIQRQFSGSQTPYFALLDEVTNLTKSVIDREENIISIAEARDTPFTSTGQAHGDAQAIGGYLEQQTAQLLQGWAQIMSQYSGGVGLDAAFKSAAFL